MMQIVRDRSRLGLLHIQSRYWTWGSLAYGLYTISPVRALSYKPMPAPVWREAPSTLKIHQSPLSWSTSTWGGGGGGGGFC